VLGAPHHVAAVDIMDTVKHLEASDLVFFTIVGLMDA
jgi:hypothetical protein